MIIQVILINFYICLMLRHRYFREQERVMKTPAKLLIVFLLLLITVPAIALTCGQSAITNIVAQDATYNAYKAIVKASNAGADTNQLIQQLNQAVNLTAQAQQLMTTNSQQAQELADQAQTIAQNVTQQAITAQQSASNVLPIIVVVIAVHLNSSRHSGLCIWSKSYFGEFGSILERTIE